MLWRFKTFLNLLLNLKSLYVFIFQRLLIICNTFLRRDPPYEFERKFVCDSATEKIVGEIDRKLESELGGNYIKYRAKWDSILQREKIGNSIARSIDNVIPFDRNGKFSSCEEELNGNGYSAIPEKNLSKFEVEQILLYLETKKVFPAHVAHRSLKKPCLKDALNNGVNPFGSYDMQTIIGSRELAKIVGDEDISNLIGNYFGCLPTLCNVNLYWSFVMPNATSTGPQSYHRDVDDHKIVNFFINLTDTAENDGAYCHIDKTHNLQQISKIFDQDKRDTVPEKLNPFGRPLIAADLFALPLNGYGFGKLYDHLFGMHVHQVFGPAGTTRCADGYGLHRAIPPKSRDRLLFWMTYSLTRSSTETAKVPHQKRTPYSKVQQNIKNTDVNRYVLRNIVNFAL